MDPQSLTLPIGTSLNDVLTLLVSSDSIAIPLKDNDSIASLDDIDILLAGDNTAYLIVEGASEQIYDMIDMCYSARENNRAVILYFDNHSSITFK